MSSFIAMCEIFTGFCLLQFLEQELLVNITKHVLVPKHEVLTRDQKAQLLKR